MQKNGGYKGVDEIRFYATRGADILGRLIQLERQELRKIEKQYRKVVLISLLLRTAFLLYCCDTVMRIVHAGGFHSMHWYDWIWQYVIWSSFVNWQKRATR